MQGRRIDQILPLVEIYMRSMHIVAPNLDQSKPIDLNIKTSVLMDVFSLLTSVTVERAKQSN